ncbi:DNA repair protein rad16 [Psilocybe cubensis]|uniref:DNA repair protein rad16 n=1 Tax=Psilocybe cubensis TaxID=181762 RepID=A0ACB8HIC2_PSICU|nr:DNA repair protein rad16 [Psilocybe cubensis]KAH9487436.1 DNA repair protein rad16 [Psilocybe cubensis]
MSTLLPFHRHIIEKIHDPATSDLLVIARGVGLRRIICTLMKIYDSPQNLVLLVNATPEEESAIGEELGIIGCRKPGLRVVSHETGSKERQGGIISVTSRILVVDMLQSDIPTELITGMMVLHAEKVTPLVLEAFIVRLFREKNKNGFIKAFTDQPEHITSGLSPLKNIMKELQIRNVHIYPRFHEELKKCLERRRADVVELSQHLTEPMADIHHAIIECMNSTLSELKRSNTNLDLDDFNVQNAYFQSFEVIVRRQLDSVWHKVGPKTKQLVNDLGILRRLLYYLLTYDALQFHSYLEVLIAANNATATGGTKQHQSPWMLTDAANIIFQSAQRRCFTVSSTSKKVVTPVIDLTEDEDAWAALDEAEGHTTAPPNKGNDKTEESRPTWLPKGLEPVLEELPKWNLLSEIILEAEGEMIRQESLAKPGSTRSNTVLVMTSSIRTCNLLTEFLSSMDHDAPPGSRGRAMMLRKLRLYLWWKGKMDERKATNKAASSMPDNGTGKGIFDAIYADQEDLSEALKKKDKEKAQRAQNRRRIRGGAPATSSSPVKGKGSATTRLEPQEIPVPNAMQNDTDEFAKFWASQGEAILAGQPLNVIDDLVLLDFESNTLENDFDTNYGLLAPEQTVLVRAYSDDTDDRILQEIRPKFIVMVEPDMDFVRRIEVYKSSNPGLAVRVYHMVYANSSEEHKYLAGIRREKDAFERLIKERGSMLITLVEDRRSDNSDSMIKTISSRLAGGRRELNKEPSRVVVDMREFRSTLPSLLHASGLQVIPATLTVGDYILTPDICVERKSLSDLKTSFNNGRLYTQCEMMSLHYKYPILLIEFEEDKAFSLDIMADMKTYGKGTRYPSKQRAGPSDQPHYNSPTIQAKIVLLTLTFPRVRIIWSSSPYATSEIFNDLKANNAEPDPSKSVTIGADDDPDVGAGINAAAEEVLRYIPGITAHNVKLVMHKVKNIEELCNLSLSEVQGILGADPGKACYQFIHEGDKR